MAIDLQDFGRLQEQVRSLTENVRELQREVAALLEVVNRARGALWLLFAVSGTLGALAGWLAHRIGITP